MIMAELIRSHLFQLARVIGTLLGRVPNQNTVPVCSTRSLALVKKLTTIITTITSTKEQIS